MKINFRKIASVLASTAMLSSTLALAAAANYPAPFVNSGNADVAVVYGSLPGAEFDLASVTTITGNLQAKLSAQSSSSGSSSSSSASGGDFIQLQLSTDKFNLGETASDFYSSLDDDELSVVLTDGTFRNDDNDDFEFTQKIELGNVLVLQHFQDSEFNDDKPTVGFDLTDNDHILNYTLDFTPDAAEGGTAFASLETTEMEMLGRSYYVVDATSTSNGVKLTLLDSANSAIVAEGETASMTVGSQTYSVGISFIDSNDVILKVNDVATNKLQEGDVYKVAGDTHVAIKNILYSEKDGGISKVEISLGSGKIVLEHGQEVEVNGEDVSDIDEYNDAEVIASIVNSSTNIDKIVLQWDLGDDTWIAPGSEIVLPAFETIKVSMGGFNVPSKEVTSIANDGDDSIRIDTEVADGKVSFNLIYSNGTAFTNLGKDSDDRLVTSNQTTLGFDKDADNWFVASYVDGDDAESYVLQVTKVDDTDATKNTTTVKNMADGTEKTFDINEAEDYGKLRLTLNGASEVLNTANFTVSAIGSSTVSFNKLYTADGLRMNLPVLNISGGLNNMTGVPAYQVLDAQYSGSSWIFHFTEEDEDGTIASGGQFNVTLGHNSDTDVHVSAVSVTDYETTDNSEEFVGYVNSSLATMTSLDTDGDQDSISIEYHDEEAYADVYVSEAGVVVASSNSTVVVGGATKELGSVHVKDTEVDSVSSKNLIVVGGSCVNTLAKELLGGAACGSDFEQKTGVGAGSFLIQSFSRTGGKVATLVAGYSAADTEAGAKVLTTQTVDTTVGKKYKGTGNTVAMVDTTSA